MTKFSKPITLDIILLEKEELQKENENLKSRIQYLETKIERERNSTNKQYEKWEKEAFEKIRELERIIKDKDAVIDEYHEQQCTEMEYKE